jgi:DNA-binding NarL/FixJ family response regulator
MKILVADDHPLLREALAYVLRDLDSRACILEAADGETVRQMVADHADLDLLLLDICLPGVTGLELFDVLRNDDPALPVVVLSAINDPDVVKAVMARGALGYLSKSSTRAVMLNALRLVLSGGRYLPPELIVGDWASVPNEPAGAAGQAAATVQDLGLTERQRQVLALLAEGKSNKQICRELGLAEATVKIHVTAILKALKVASRTQAVVAINRLGLRLDQPPAAQGQGGDT